MSKEDHPLFEAARFLDDAADGSEETMEEMTKRLGLPDADKAKYAAEQRALRCTLLVTGEVGKLEGLSRSQYTTVQLSPVQERVRQMLLPAIYDSLMVGWKAHEFATTP